MTSPVSRPVGAAISAIVTAAITGLLIADWLGGLIEQAPLP